MVPAMFQNLWKTGLDTKAFYLKLCGSGGGGFLLGFTEILVINEEVLLCLCFITFVFVGFASANIDVFNSLNQKPKDIKTTFLDSINNKLNFFSETNRWFFSNN